MAAAIAGCGGSSAPGLRTATLVLDFTPNAVHAGIYAAIAHHIDRANGIRLRVIVPSATTDSIKLLEAGRVNFAILDIHDLAIARERGAGIVGILAIVERPLAAVIAAPAITSPRQLEGRPVGVTGAPSDTAVLDSVVAGAGGDPRRVRAITIGFNAVADLLAGKVAAATAFWNDEGVTLRRDRPGFRVFRVDQFGAPAYPELVLCASAAELRRDHSLALATARTIVSGYRFALRTPAAAASELEALVPGLDAGLVSAQLHALLPAFRAANGRVGVLDTGVLARWARWEERFRLVDRRPDIAAMFDPQLANTASAIGPFQ
jgi:NitT/TauT family transport system substrate-binding protein/putative hydroxymethylpyrimidine transport system substrate-binding protein